MARGSDVAAWALSIGLATAYGACGRSSLPVNGGQGGGATASSSQSTTSGVSSSSGGMGGGPPCITWSVAPGAPVALTDFGGDSLLTSTSVEGSNVFVASLNDDDPSPDPTWRIRVVSGDLQTIEPSQIVLEHLPSVSIAGMSVATSLGHRGGIAWDEGNGCRFIALGEDGSAVAGVEALGDQACYWLTATAAGFVAFSSPSYAAGPLSLITIAPASLDVTPSIISPASFVPLTHALFDDGTLLLGWQSDASVVVQHVDETGTLLSMPLQLIPYMDGSTIVALGSLGSSGLVAWAPGSSSPGEVDVQAIDEDGNPTGPSTLLAASDGATVNALDVKAVAGGAMVIWAEGVEGEASVMMAQVVTPAGSPLGAPLVVPTPASMAVQNVRIAPTPEGIVVAFSGSVPMTPAQVFALRLVCGG
jgi:hypothetical protein